MTSQPGAGWRRACGRQGGGALLRGGFHGERQNVAGFDDLDFAYTVGEGRRLRQSHGLAAIGLEDGQARRHCHLLEYLPNVYAVATGRSRVRAALGGMRHSAGQSPDRGSADAGCWLFRPTGYSPGLMQPYRFGHRHLLGIEGLSREDIEHVLDRADAYVELSRQSDKKTATLRGRTLINCFFENSTRTRTSFEVAGKRLGADVINMAVAVSAMRKGETLIDTAMTLNAMHPDVLVVRHPESGAVQLLSEKVDCAVINGGDGSHEHPTQALLDALTIRRRKGRLGGLTVAICGDILHSRVARSNIALLNVVGARVRVVAPRTLLPAEVERLGVEVFHDMTAGLRDVDIVMMLRLQMERMHGSFIPSSREYFHFFGLDYDKLKLAKPDALIMHPGPMNRGVEIGSEVADDIDRSLIRQQVEMGVAVRMACLEILTRGLGNNPPVQ
jgi:aspartate carbamoyltransferase catalytic subunit